MILLSSALLRWSVLLVAALALAGLAAYFLVDPARLIAVRQAKNDARVREDLAHHVGVLAFVYGYPIVDMTQQMHNETHRVGGGQRVYAPVNRIFSYGALLTPSTQGNLRMPNHDTLYFSGWYDVSREPLILRTPDTGGRYFTIAITNLYSEVEHIGRRTTGTAERLFALVPPGWAGALPAGVTPLTTESTRGWLLGRMLVTGERDAKAGLALIDQTWTVPLRDYVPGQKPALGPEQSAPAMKAMGDLSFFDVLNDALRALPPRPGEAALMAQLDAIGIGPHADFDAARLDPETRRGLERALADGRALVQAAGQRSRGTENGWIVPRAVGRYGFDYLARAVVVLNGYGNLPEESLYAAALLDSGGKLLTGRGRYRIRFAKGALPPVDAFWSLTVYDLRSAKLVENEIARYSVGDHAPGLVFGPDGSLSIALQHERPEEEGVNWLPTPGGPLPIIAVMRMYEPRETALRGEYTLPAVVRVE